MKIDNDRIMVEVKGERITVRFTSHMSNNRTIVWFAYQVDNYDGPGSPLGTGDSKQSALNNLLERIR
jgi:hypothetical protein